MLRQYFRFGTENSKIAKVEDLKIDDIEDPCFGCLILPACQVECGERAAYKILEYLDSNEIDPNTYEITATQKKGRMETETR